MSDHWQNYPCQMGDHFASITYDHGISESIDALAQPNLLKIRVPFTQSHPNGMPTNEEFPRLTALDDELEALVRQHDALYVGRVTVDRHRHFYIYTSESEEAWAPRLVQVGANHGYELACRCEADAERKGYWQELFPTDDDWQVIQDLSVLDTLAKHGDDGTASRRVDHWAYFPSPFAAAQFTSWATEQGYEIEESNETEAVEEADAADGDEENPAEKFCVRFSHEGSVTLAEITSHTTALRRQADEFDGRYDGWETLVCKSEQ